MSLKTSTNCQPHFLQELRDLLAIVVMLVALKLMLVGNAPLGSVLQHILPDRAVASNHAPVNTPATPAPETDGGTLDKEAYETMSHRLAYLDALLETMNAAPETKRPGNHRTERQ